MSRTDALRHDFVDAQRMPWLTSLDGQGARRATLEETFGFIGVRSSVFYGLYPEDTGYVFLYNVADRGTLWFLRYLPRSWLDASPRRKRRIVRRYSRLRRRFDPEFVKPWDLSKIPARILPHVQVAETIPPWSPRYVPGRRGLFQEVGSHLYLGYPATGGDTKWLTQTLMERFEGQQFVWMHYSQVDHSEHEHGASSQEVVRELREIDQAIHDVYSHVSARGEVDLLVFGDHGCADVVAHHDVLGWLPADLRERSLYYLDSTMARFWCPDAGAREAVREILDAHSDCGTTVSPDVLEGRYRCRYERTIFGDVLFVANPGSLVCPNFFQATPNEVKGMHGYLPEAEDNCAAALLYTGRDVELPARCEMPRLHGVLRELLELDGR